MQLRLKEGFAYSSHDSVAIYDGSGFLATENGARIACQFRADQEFSGVVQVVFHRILPPDFAFHLIPLIETGASASFRGTTASGATVIMDAERGGRPLSLDDQGYGSMYFLPRKIAVYEKAPPTTGHRFLLTNFTFSPFTHLGEPPHHPPPHRLSLKIDGQDVDPEIKPLPDYVQRVVTLWQTRAIIPTCELQISTVPDKSQEWPFDLAGRICRLLSVAAGTVIEWITAYGVNENNERTRCVHAARRTKPFCSLPVVPIREFGYDANTRMLQEFLQNGLEQSSARDRHRMNAVVAAYLDARLESDFVEARGIKTVVVLEMLKNLFSEEYSSKEWNKLMPKSLRKRISVVVKNALKQSEIPAGPADAVQEMMGQLNRPPFKRLVAYMIEQLGLVEDESVVKAIILARNSLVHTGQFLSVKDPEKAKELGFTDAAHEFFALLTFVDRILLRVVGHAGMYMNYSGCSPSGYGQACLGSTAVRELTKQPGLGRSPVARHGFFGDLQNLGRLLDAEPTEKTQFDDSRFSRIDPGEGIERFI